MRFADQAVEALAKLLDAVGMNGTRLRWRWNQRQRLLGEQGVRAELMWRSAKAPHTMCPHCRALVPRAARRCTECGESLRGVSSPGLGRVLSNLMPGISGATSLLAGDVSGGHGAGLMPCSGGGTKDIHCAENGGTRTRTTV